MKRDLKANQADFEPEDEADGKSQEKKNDAKKTESDKKSAKKQVNLDEDNDNDINEPDAYTKQYLIPNCFGVYKQQLN